LLGERKTLAKSRLDQVPPAIIFRTVRFVADSRPLPVAKIAKRSNRAAAAQQPVLAAG
jgi:hypothetical protein